MKKKWSFITISFIILFLISFWVTCSKKDDATNEDISTSNSGKNHPGELNIVDGKIEPPVTITTVLAELPNTRFREGESLTDNVHTRWAKEQLGVNIEVLWHAPRTDRSFEERMKLALAAGQEFPDVFVSLDKQLIELLVESGLVMDVGEAFEKYASETYKAAMTENSSQIWWPFMRDGKKYAIPIIHEHPGSQSVMWIRQDWLENLGLEAPVNLEELETIMEAFTNQDPNDSGKKDTIALALTARPNFTINPIGASPWVFGMFGALPERWYPNEDGELQYGSVQSGIKDALMKIREWREKGYISNELALGDFHTVSADMASDKVGIIAGPKWLNNYSRNLHRSNSGAKYKPYPLPEGVDGNIMRTVDNPYLGGIFFNKKISDEALQAFFHYQNTLYSIYESEDPFLFKDFQEGYDYIIKDGEAITSNEWIPGGRILTMKYMLAASPPVYNSKQTEANLKHARGEVLTTQDFAALAANGELGMSSEDLIARQALLVALKQEHADVPEYFHGPTTQTMSRRWEMLMRMEMETFLDIIYARKPVDAFDEFVENWHSNGGDNITKEVNEWYDSVK